MLSSKLVSRLSLYLILFFLCVPAVLYLWLIPYGNSLQSISLAIAVAVMAGTSAWLIARLLVSESVGGVMPEVAKATHKIIQASLDAIITVNKHGQVIEFNPSAERIFGYSAEYAKQRNLTELIIPEQLKQQHSVSFQRFIDTGEKNIIDTRIEVPAVNSDGEEFPVEMTLTTIEQEGQTLVTACLRDLTAKKEAEEQALIAYTVFSKASEGIMVTNRHNQIKAVNPAFLRITGYQKEEVLGRNPAILSSGRHDDTFYNTMWTKLSMTGSWEGEVWNRRRNGEVYPQQLSIDVVKDTEGNISDHVAVFADITRRKQNEKQIIHQATHDVLTGLPNRTLFFDRLMHAMAGARREAKSIAVLFVDLDGFKPINDQHGHLVGDKLLKEVALRLGTAVREVDTVARFGGDEFALVLDSADQDNFTQSVAEKLLRLVKAPYIIDEKEMVIGCSIGVAFFQRDGETPDQLIACADKAMYRAKSLGGDCYDIGLSLDEESDNTPVDGALL